VNNPQPPQAPDEEPAAQTTGPETAPSKSIEEKKEEHVANNPIPPTQSAPVQEAAEGPTPTPPEADAKDSGAPEVQE